MGRSSSQPGRRIVDWPNDVVNLAAALGAEHVCRPWLVGRGAVRGRLRGAHPQPRAGRRRGGRRGAERRAGLPKGDERPAADDVPARPLRPRGAPPPLAVESAGRPPRRRAERRADGVVGSAAQSRPAARVPRSAPGSWPASTKPVGRGPPGPAEDIGLIARPWGFNLQAVKVPVLLWHGELNRNVPVVAGRYLANALPHCRAMFYPEEAHLSLLLNRQREFLGTLAAAVPAL